MSGPGLTRLYKDGLSVDLADEDLAKAVAEGWKDTPQPAPKVDAPAKAKESK